MSTTISKDFAPGLMQHNYFTRKGLKEGIEFFAGRLKGRMLDFGCGAKPYRSLFTVDEYIGIDYENEGHSHKNEQIDVFYDGKHIPFPDEHFDAVLCTEVIEHVFNLEEVLKELNRVTRKDAKLLFTCPFVWNEHEVPYDFARYTRFAIESLFERNGFEIVEFRKSGNFITTIGQMVCLYAQESIYPVMKKIAPLRWLYKILFMLGPNVSALVLNKLLPANQSLYLNNIFVARKK